MCRLRVEANNRYGCLNYDERRLVSLFEFLADWRPCEPPGGLGTFSELSGDLSVAFLDDAELARIHADFLDNPAPTDVITFPGDPADGSAGEICVSVERAEVEAGSRGEPFFRELTLYLVHGWLHLVGFDDLEEPTRAAMRRAEAETLFALEEAGLFPDFHLAAPSCAE